MSARALLAVLAASAAAFALYGYSFGHHNHAIQLPLVRHRQDPSLFPGDAFVATLDGYASVFWVLVARATRVLPLGPTFLVGHVLTLVATSAGVFALARAAWPERAGAPYVALLLWLGLDPALGGEALHWFYFAHTPVAAAVAVWCLAAFTSGRARGAWLLAGLAFDLHALQGAYLAAALTAGTLAERGGARRLGTGVLCFALAAAPALVWLARTAGGAAPDDLALLLRAFYPEHFFPSTFGARAWGAVGLCAAVLLRARARGGQAARRLAAAGAGLVLLGALAGASAEVAPIGAVLKLHALRAGTLLVVVALALAAGELAALVARRGALEGLGWVLLALLASRAFDVHAGVTALPWVVEAGLGAAALLGAARCGALRRAVAGAGALVLALVLADVLRTHTRYARALDRERAAWVDVQRWAHARGDPRDLYLTPPGWSGFRCFAERPVVGEWKDGAAVMWDAAFAPRWRAWYAAVGGRFDDLGTGPIDARLRAAWRAKTPDEIGALARAYGARAIVLARAEHGKQAPHPWRGARLYENAGFFVVATPAQ
jgi:hypothetical protein